MSGERIYEFSCSNKKCGKKYLVGESDQKMIQSYFYARYYAGCPYCRCLTEWNSGCLIGFAEYTELSEDRFDLRSKRFHRRVFQ